MLPLSIDTWTIFSTLVTGALLGFFIFAGSVALMIYSESKARPRRADVPKLPAGLTTVLTQDQVYDHDQSRHIA